MIFCCVSGILVGAGYKRISRIKTFTIFPRCRSKKSEELAGSGSLSSLCDSQLVESYKLIEIVPDAGVIGCYYVPQGLIGSAANFCLSLQSD